MVLKLIYEQESVAVVSSCTKREKWTDNFCSSLVLVSLRISFQSFPFMFQGKRSKESQLEQEDGGRMFEFPILIVCLLQIGVKLMLK